LVRLLKLDRITLAKSPFQTPISAAHSIGLEWRRRSHKSNRESDPAISSAISGAVREMGMSSLLAYLTRSSYTRLASASIKSKVRGHKSNVSVVRRLGGSIPQRTAELQDD